LLVLYIEENTLYQRALSFYLSILPLTLTSCGSDSKSLQQADGGSLKGASGDARDCPDGNCSPHNLALGFFSGFRSCGSSADGSANPMTDSFKDIYKKVENTVGENEVSLAIRGCYDTDASKVRFTLSNLRQTISSTVPEMIKIVGEELKKIAPVKLHLVGHSYGGWTIMQLAKNIPPEIKIEGITTIDPISVKECNTAVYASLILGGGNINGCQRAPADFAESDIKAIRSRTNRWTNYYQNNFPLLHSGPIAAATNNEKSYYSLGFEPHNDFLRDESVIQEIVNSVQNSK
jgi:pimeloyl-ACP methyl ester carboxylesterase